MNVKECLVGKSKIRVETTKDDYEYELKNEKTVIIQPNTPKEIKSYLEETEDFTVETNFETREYTDYVHDESTQYDRQEIANSLDLSEDHKIVSAISNQTYEISLTYKIKDEDTCLLVAVNNNKLENPPNII